VVIVLLVVIVVLLVAILCRLDARAGVFVKRTLHGGKILLFVTLGAIVVLGCGYLLSPYASEFLRRLSAGDMWAWVTMVVLVALVTLACSRLTGYFAKQHRWTLHSITLVVWLAACLSLAVPGLPLLRNELRVAAASRHLVWTLYAVVGGMILVAFVVGEVRRYRECRAKDRTLGTFLRNCCGRYKCRSGSMHGVAGCAACNVCLTYRHTTLGHPRLPTAEIEPELESHERQLSDRLFPSR